MSTRIRQRLIALRVLGDGRSGTAGTWQLPLGWVQLRESRLWHRPHPEQSYWVMCELLLPSPPGSYPRRTTNDPACPRLRRDQGTRPQ